MPSARPRRQPSSDSARPRRGSAGSGRTRWLAAALAGLPAGGSGFLLYAGYGHLTILITILVLSTVLTGAVTVLLSVQETRRTEIRLHSINTIADAVADAIHAAHTPAENAAVKATAEEAARSRTSAYRLLNGPASSLLTALTSSPDPDERTHREHGNGEDQR